MGEQNAASLTAVGYQPTKKRTDDDVIYLGTYKVKDSTHTVDASLSTPERNSRLCRDHVASTRPRLRKSHHGRIDMASTLKIPAEMTYKHVRLGVMKDFIDLRRAVYGFFDRAGRLRRRTEIRKRTGTADLVPWLSAALVAHDQVEYRPCFRGLTHQQVRKELRCQLARKLYSHAADGEI
ncbi:hypothetical protein CDEST_01295 [Colletotrichum destructivum]|uniref:Uncharacterized protein n=1 Tax=Colletotrichum destructivum TaxID=34406 RepID=A0AAX4HYM1_9PEZI|nr:hypothetical protein CDEST_01295 [Colletotrichum destructivum]